MKLTREEGIKQAAGCLIESAGAREGQVEKQEAKEMAKEMVKRTSRKAENTRSQKGCRARKKEKEIQSGVRGPDGKIKKVMRSEHLNELPCSC